MPLKIEIRARKLQRMLYAAVIVTVIASIGLFSACTRPDQKASVPPEKITLACSTPPYTTLVDIALKKGYFLREGLDVTPQTYSYGKLAFDALLAGKADIATVGETPFILAVMRGGKFSIIATIQTSNRNNAIVARKDKGILGPADLKGRKIGSTFGTVGDFFLDAFLVSHGISREQVKEVNLPPEEMGNALASGEVDAVSTWSPVLSRLQKQLDGKGTVFYDADIYTQTFSLAAKREYIQRSPGKVRKALRALVRAEEFAGQHPGEAQAIIAAAGGTNAASAAAMWNDNTYSVTLDQSLLLAMEDESRWAIKNRLTKATRVPNYLDYIYFEGLESVKPKAVRILR